MFLVEVWSKYGHLHLKELLEVIYQMNIQELLPEVLCWRRAEQPLKGRRKTTNFGQTKKPTTQFTQFIFK